MTCQPADRGKVVSYLLSALRGDTPERYQAAIADFSIELRGRGFCLEEVEAEELDWLLAEKVVDLVEAADDSSVGLGRAGLLIAAVSKARPHAKFRVAWKALDVWRTKQPPQQAAAFTPEMAFACGIRCILVYGQIEAGVSIILCFCALLRASECLRLRRCDVLDLGSSIVIVIGVAKRGLEQKVSLSHPRVVLFLREYVIRTASRGPGERLVQLSYGKLQHWLQRSVRELGFPGHWTSHGLRRGGATELFRKNISLNAIAQQGRWLSERSMREYLRRGEVAQLRLAGSIAPATWKEAERLAAIGERVWAIKDGIDGGRLEGL